MTEVGCIVFDTYLFRLSILQNCIQSAYSQKSNNRFPNKIRFIKTQTYPDELEKHEYVLDFTLW